MKTIFIDIDGTVLRHNGDLTTQVVTNCDVLDGVVQKFNDWNRKGYHIILTTVRKECMRDLTINQLKKAGLFYDQLVMGLPRGQRVQINDKKPDMENTAVSFSVERNKGIRDIEV